MTTETTADKLFRLQFVVQTVTWCHNDSSAADIECGAAVGIRFLGYPEQAVCDVAAADPAVAGPTRVDAGQTFTFAVADNRPVIDVEIVLYRLMGVDTLPSRVELGTGFIQLPLDTIDAVLERDVTVMDAENRSVAVLAARVRVLCAGPVLATPVWPEQLPADIVVRRERNACALNGPIPIPDHCLPPPL